MADKTQISWTDSTFNPWWGCTKVSPGCDHCYAEAFDKRTGGNYWGTGKLRMLSDANWKKPLTWQRKAAKEGKPRKVFCGSMCDWADKNADNSLRHRLWDIISRTPMLNWQLLTKRATNIQRYLPHDWHEGYSNVWMGVSVENQKHGLPRIDILREIPAKIRFLSMEPLLEDLGDIDFTGIHWVIVGGESGPMFRIMEHSWVDSIRRQCKEQNVPFFFKQWSGCIKKNGALDGREVKAWPKISETAVKRLQQEVLAL